MKKRPVIGIISARHDIGKVLMQYTTNCHYLEQVEAAGGLPIQLPLIPGMGDEEMDAYILEHGNPFRKIALRCPAVNMADALTDNIIEEEELIRIRSGESILVGFDRKIEVNHQFLLDLEKADIQKSDFSAFSRDILIIHGTEDVSFEAGRRFSECNSIWFIPVEGADHRFQDPKCIALANEKILDFFRVTVHTVRANCNTFFEENYRIPYS